MKIALLSFDIAPLNERLKLEAETLTDQGHEVHVIYARVSAAQPRRYETKGVYRESFVGVDGSNRLGRALSLPLVHGRILRLLRADPPQVVHCAHPLLLPAALICKQACAAKIVYDA